MRFKVIANKSSVPTEGRDIGYLWADNWNDWWEFSTLYSLTYFDAEGVKHILGGVKIGEFNWPDKQDRPSLPRTFTQLGPEFFSLGQDDSYYEDILALGEDVADRLLTALNDVVRDDDLFARASSERVLGRSLMRSVTRRTVVQQFKRIISGGVRLTKYRIHYRSPRQLDPAFTPVELDFVVRPLSKPPTNVHVIVGRNGVGKSFYLNAMSRALVHPNGDVDEDGEFSDPDDLIGGEFESPFASVLSVTFSAFDDFAMLEGSRNRLKGVQYTNVGLRKRIKDAEGNRVTITQQPRELAKEFIESAKVCSVGKRRARWRTALRTLQSDPIFEDAQISNLLDLDENDFGREAGRRFRRLSSGHKIVLLTITKLVEKVEERTLVLMDEPEAHLHPPLLSGLIRAISDLLVNRNGVAIVATHSPVVLQEVPKECVWKLRRHGGAAVAERPLQETFAEHVGVLTHEVFGLEVTRSGFQRMLQEAVGPNDDFDDVLEKFDEKVGTEGRALISSLIADRDQPEIGSDD
ncbi:ATP-dependent nuclease [Paracoccus yeei]|uniref:ATP-dependent nuclease n=1 Tax=Paracoccus yeei TaxID=147645 RepID=UPI001C2BE185|nr:AAA family ATPase [Paracoccus yeei]